MKEGRPLIDGLILMEVALRGPEHPGGPNLKVQYALVQVREGGGLSTCGKLTYEALPALEAWPEEVKGAYQTFVDVLEEHMLRTGGVFEETDDIDREVVHAVVAGTEPEEF
jgi:hypothetical protein